MSDFVEDIEKYLSGENNKKEFINNVYRGAGDNDSTGGYDFEKAKREAGRLNVFSKRLYSYAEEKMLVDAFDEIIYSFGQNDSGYKGMFINFSRASSLALNAMSYIVSSEQGRKATENLYKEKNLNPNDEAVNIVYLIYNKKAFLEIADGVEESLKKFDHITSSGVAFVKKRLIKHLINHKQNAKVTEQIRFGVDKSTPIKEVAADAPFKVTPIKRGRGE